MKVGLVHGYGNPGRALAVCDGVVQCLSNGESLSEILFLGGVENPQDAQTSLSEQMLRNVFKGLPDADGSPVLFVPSGIKLLAEYRPARDTCEEVMLAKIYLQWIVGCGEDPLAIVFCDQLWRPRLEALYRRSDIYAEFYSVRTPVTSGEVIRERAACLLTVPDPFGMGWWPGSFLLRHNRLSRTFSGCIGEKHLLPPE